MNLSHSLTPVIRVLLVCVCLSFVTGCIGASKPPTFVKVGKKYLYGNGVQGGVILIKKNMGNGWYLVEAQDDDKPMTFYFNMAHATILKEVEEP